MDVALASGTHRARAVRSSRPPYSTRRQSPRPSSHPLLSAVRLYRSRALGRLCLPILATSQPPRRRHLGVKLGTSRGGHSRVHRGGSASKHRLETPPGRRHRSLVVAPPRDATSAECCGSPTSARRVRICCLPLARGESRQLQGSGPRDRHHPNRARGTRIWATPDGGTNQVVRGRPARRPPFCLSRGRHVPRARRRSPPVRRAARAHVLHNPKQQLEATGARAREESVLGGRSAALSDDRQQLPTLQSESPRSYSLSPEKFTRSLEDWQTLTEPPLVISFVIAFLCDGFVDTYCFAGPDLRVLDIV